MDSRSVWITIGFLLILVFVGPFRIVGCLYDVGLVPKATEEQVVTELKQLDNVRTATCQNGSPNFDFVCDYDVQARGRPPERRRVGIRTGLYKAIGSAVPLPGPVLTEAEKLQWQYEEQQKQQTQEQGKRTQEQKKRTEELKRASRVNVRTATIAELRTIPRVDQYRAQEIHAAVRFGLVRQFDDLLKIQGIDQATLNAMRTRAYWE
jgi:hypothetical protein